MENNILADLIAKTADVFLKNTTETIFTRIDVAKKEGDREKAILKLEEIINDLLDDRAKLNQIIKKYEEILSVQRISDEDINYITDNIIPILSKLFTSGIMKKNNNITTDDINEIMELLKPLFSIEIFKILQLLGFNFKEAIGIPLTQLIKNSINKVDEKKLEYEYAIAVNKREEELFKLLQTQEGRKIYKELIQKQKSIL